MLQPSLPRLMEAVVKSLDPNSNSNRELVLDAATEIVGYVVKTYVPSVVHLNVLKSGSGSLASTSMARLNVLPSEPTKAQSSCMT